MDAQGWLSVTALVISLVSAAVAWSASRKQNDMQQRLLDLESARERDRVAERNSAALRAEFVEHAGGGHKLHVTNEGAAAARAINIQIDGAPLEESPRALVRPGEMLRILGPGAEVSYHVPVHHGIIPFFHIELQWIDDSGVPGKWESQLKVW